MAYRLYASVKLLSFALPISIYLLCGIFNAVNAKELSVMVTIKPVHSLVAAVTEGVLTPELILTGNESPHFYSLKPSTVRKLQDAAVVFYVSDTLENFMVRSLSLLDPKNTTVVELMDTDGIIRLKNREGSIWGNEHADSEEVHDYEEEHVHHDHGIYDPHIWLNPQNAVTMLHTIVKVLSEKDPEHAAIYQTNASKMAERIKTMDKTLSEQLELYKTTPYLVFHDGYHYLEDHYGLHAVGAITLSPERKPSAKNLQHIRKIIVEQNVACIFTEPQMASSSLEFLVEKDKITVGMIDYLGVNVDAGKEAYLAIMQHMVDNIVGCFLK